jgi:HEAT repeat protein
VLSFEAVCRIGIKDVDPKVRELSVQTLWEYETVDLIPVFLQMVVGDDDMNVRMASAIALGTFVYLGELEEIREATLREVEDRLLEVVNGADQSDVRQRALESLGYSSRGEVPKLIEKAYYSGNDDWLVSALHAMGRSANRKWAPKVVEMLKSDSANVRAEAASALGELEIKKTVPDLLPLIQDDDDEVRMAAIWSLSKIGGEGVREVLEELFEATEDEEEADFIASAMENLAFSDESGLLGLWDMLEEDDYPELLEDDDDLDD